MDTDYAELTNHFGQLSDGELLTRFRANTLTEIAKAIALEEIIRRNLDVPVPEEIETQESEYAGDFELVARFLNPTDAFIVCSCLEAAGVPAVVADAQLVQTNSLWAIALGGARILVPASYITEAKNVIAAFNRGEFTLPDNDESVA